MMYHRWFLYRLLIPLAGMALLVPSLIGPGLAGGAVARAAAIKPAGSIPPPGSGLTPDGDPLLLVHGLDDTCQSAFNQTDVVPNTGLNAITTVQYLIQNGWDASALDDIGYYDPSLKFLHNLYNGTQASSYDNAPFCNHNLYQMNELDQHAANLCSSLLTEQNTTYAAGTDNDPLEHLGCLLAWYIFDTYGGHPVDILAHSMGGLIVRDAIGESGHGLPNSWLFPPTPLNVHVVVTVGTPHGGLYGSYYQLAKTLYAEFYNRPLPHEVVDMESDPNTTSPFMQLLDTYYLLHAQGLFGTTWNLIASSIPCSGGSHDGVNKDFSYISSCSADSLVSNNPYPDGDGVVQSDSALAMPADFKVLYGAGIECFESTPCSTATATRFDGGGIEYAHAANTCGSGTLYGFTISGCLGQPFYLNDGTPGYTQGWLCTGGCTSGFPGPGGGGMADVSVGIGSATSQPIMYSLAEMVNLLSAYGPGTVPSSSGSGRMVVLSGGYTFVAIGNTLYKYDLGTTGNTMLSISTDGTSGPDYLGNQVYSYPITAIAVNTQYLFVALGNNRVVKSTLCGSGNNMCALSDGSGSGSVSGYHYWIGYQNLNVPVTGLAATTSYLYINLAGGSVMRTLKTTLCGGGANMCALSDGIGTSGLAGYSYWVGRQDWSWAPTVIAANDSIVLTTIGGTRVCKTTLGSSGSNVFALSDNGTCTGSYSSSYHFWIGYQDWSVNITSLAVDSSHIWWSLENLGNLGSQEGRLVQTTWCGSASNMCALLDGIGSDKLNGSSYWVGRQDWCSGYNQMGVASNGQFVDALYTFGSYTRVVKSTASSGANMFATADCAGTQSLPDWFHWIGSQNLTVS